LATVGVLRPTPSDLRVRTYAFEWLAGWFLMGALALWGSCLVLAIEVSAGAGWSKLVGGWVVAGAACGLCWAMYRCFVWPYGRLRKPFERSITALENTYTQLQHWAKNRLFRGRKP
jgi:hypothetical protein